MGLRTFTVYLTDSEATESITITLNLAEATLDQIKNARKKVNLNTFFGFKFTLSDFHVVSGKGNPAITHGEILVSENDWMIYYEVRLMEESITRFVGDISL